MIEPTSPNDHWQAAKHVFASCARAVWRWLCAPGVPRQEQEEPEEYIACPGCVELAAALERATGRLTAARVLAADMMAQRDRLERKFDVTRGREIGTVSWANMTGPATDVTHLPERKALLDPREAASIKHDETKRPQRTWHSSGRKRYERVQVAAGRVGRADGKSAPSNNEIMARAGAQEPIGATEREKAET